MTWTRRDIRRVAAEDFRRVDDTDVRDARHLSAVPIGTGGITISEADAAWLDLQRRKLARKGGER